MFQQLDRVYLHRDAELPAMLQIAEPEPMVGDVRLPEKVVAE